MLGPAFWIVLIRLYALDVVNCVLPSAFKINLNVVVVVVGLNHPPDKLFDQFQTKYKVETWYTTKSNQTKPKFEEKKSLKKISKKISKKSQKKILNKVLITFKI